MHEWAKATLAKIEEAGLQREDLARDGLCRLKVGSRDLALVVLDVLSGYDMAVPSVSVSILGHIEMEWHIEYGNCLELLIQDDIVSYVQMYKDSSSREGIMGYHLRTKLMALANWLMEDAAARSDYGDINSG